MRIVAGEWRGRGITTLPEGDRTIRPTSDKARGAIFNILHSNYGLPNADTHVLDMCCGTGALGLEALSRGAAHCTFFDNNTVALKLVKQSADKFDATERATIQRADAANLPATSAACDLVFCDPPYNKGIIPVALEQMRAKGWIKPNSLLVLEIASDEALHLPDGFETDDMRCYGAAQIVFARAV